MRSSWGRQVTYALFGESHGEGVGISIHHLPPGLELDEAFIRACLDRRRPGTGLHTTPRQETDYYQVLSGVYKNRLTGAPLTVFFPNRDKRSKDYSSLVDSPRPSHADLVAKVKFGGFNDPRGGGHFSGRLTAPLVFAGALAQQLLAERGQRIFAHVQQIGSVHDRVLDPLGADFTAELYEHLRRATMPMIDSEKAKQALALIEQQRMVQDSVGGMVAVGVSGMTVGLGEPFFDSLESQLAHLLFSVPGVKSLAFGLGEDFAKESGSRANDPWIDGGATASNHSGGINGGISNGMPLLFKVAIRPTPSIATPQNTFDHRLGRVSTLRISGRHDPCIVTRACPVVEAVTALALLECHLDQERGRLCQTC